MNCKHGIPLYDHCEDCMPAPIAQDDAETIRQLQAERDALIADNARLREALTGWPIRTDIEGLGDDDGFWRSCSGCHELNEGQPTGPYNPVLSCHVGIGCGECGGIGAVWDTTDYTALGAS